MAGGTQHITYVAGSKVHGPGPAAGGEDRHSGLSADVVLPFIGMRMPVQLSQSSRLHGNQRCRNRGGGLEILRISNADFAASSSFGRLLGEKAIEVGNRHGPLRPSGSLLLGIQIARQRRLKNVEFLFGNSVQGSRLDSEIFRQHVARSVRHPVGNLERIKFRKTAIIEHQQKFASVGTEALYRVRYARGEIPKVALLDVLDEAASLGIDRGDARLAINHV